MRRRYRKRGTGLAKKAYRIAKRNSRRVQGETKIVNTTVAQQITQTVGNVTFLCSLGQGTADIARIGDDVRATSLTCKFHLEQSTDDPTAVTRIMIFRLMDDVDQNVTPPTMHGTAATDILEDATPLSNIDWVNRKKYKIIYSELFAGNADSVENWVWERHFKLRGAGIHFKGTVGNQGGKGSLFLGMFTDGAATANNPTLTARIRLKFSDS